jgi:hypothetical protein
MISTALLETASTAAVALDWANRQARLGQVYIGCQPPSNRLTRQHH